MTGRLVFIFALIGWASTCLAQEGTWAFDSKPDTFRPDALVDLSHLNEAAAGETGYVSVNDEGDFIRGDGSLLRFWAVNSDVWRKELPALREHAKFLAKHGVNNVRWHGNIRNIDGPIDSIDTAAREQLWQLVSAMKAEGIYTTLSPYYAHATPADKTRKNWGLPRDPKASNTGSLLFFDPQMQSAYKNWLRQLLTPVNPHTGVALKDEPAIAILQIQNEDSLLFWTINALAGEDREILRKQFGQWLVKKYGTLAKAKQAWGGVEAQGGLTASDWESGSVEIGNAWCWFQPNLNNGNLGKRMSDEVAFLVETMRNWNGEVERFLREEIQAKHLVNPGNWRTADPLRLNDLERHSYDAQSVIGMNRYTGAMHEGKYNGWAVVKGDFFTNKSVTLNPGDLPVAIKQVQGKAMILPEGNWVPPNLYQSEGPFLVAAYSGLNGVDAYFWFSTGETQWRNPSSANGYLPSIGKWVIATPPIMGNFYAAALMHRMGYIDRGEPAVVEHRSLADLWRRLPPIISEEGTFDPNRDAKDLSDALPIKTAVNRLAFLVGPVRVIYDSNPTQTLIADLKPFIHEDDKTVESNTHQLRWDYGQGIVTLNAPKAQGVCGFLNKVPRHLTADLVIESTNDYATILVVSMDDKPLADSQKVLVQVGTTARPTGWQEQPGTIDRDKKKIPALQILDHGKAPWLIADTKVTLTLRNPSITQATAIDANGYAAGDLPLLRQDGGVKITLPTDTMHIVLHQGPLAARSIVNRKLGL